MIRISFSHLVHIRIFLFILKLKRRSNKTITRFSSKGIIAYGPRTHKLPYLTVHGVLSVTLGIIIFQNKMWPV